MPRVVTSRKRKRTYRSGPGSSIKRRKYADSGSGAPPRTLSLKQGDRHVVSLSRMVTSLLSTAAATDTFTAFEFNLADVPGYTQYTALFDQYRMVAVKLELTPLQVNTTVFTSAGALAGPGRNQAPVVLTCIDLDDANTPSASTIEQHESCMMHGTLSLLNPRKIVRWCKPAVAIEAYQTGGFGGYSSKQGAWIDTASPNVQHYGIKLGILANGVGDAYYWQQTLTYYMDFKYPV